MPKKETMTVQGTDVSILTHRQDDYISLTDIAKYKDEQNPRFIIQNWMRNRNTVEFLGIWDIIKISTVSDSRRLKLKQG